MISPAIKPLPLDGEMGGLLEALLTRLPEGSNSCKPRAEVGEEPREDVRLLCGWEETSAWEEALGTGRDELAAGAWLLGEESADTQEDAGTVWVGAAVMLGIKSPEPD